MPPFFRPSTSRARQRAPRRGAAAIGLSLALLAVLVGATTSFLLIVAVRAKQSAYERNAIQALYGAEAGVETTLAMLAAHEELPDILRGTCGDATWEAAAEQLGRTVRVTATGAIRAKVGPVIQRKIVVEALPTRAGYRMVSWTRVPSEPPPQRDPTEKRELRLRRREG